MKILVTGASGLVGSNLVKALEIHEYNEILKPSHDLLDFKDCYTTAHYIKTKKPVCVIHCAAVVGGIKANMADPYKFLYDNLQIQNSVINGSIEAGVEKVIFLGSSCVYPKDYKQPLKEEYLLQAPPEPTNEGYSVAKIAGLKLCEYANKSQDRTKFISLMPCNIYGPGGDFDLNKSHVISALIKRICDAEINGDPSVTIWGTGTQKREFMYVEDLSDGIIWAMENLEITDKFFNIGTGIDVTIKELAQKIAQEIGYSGYLKFDTSMPDGMKRKCLDVSRINSMGWRAKTSLEEGIKKTIEYYKSLRT